MQGKESLSMCWMQLQEHLGQLWLYLRWGGPLVYPGSWHLHKQADYWSEICMDCCMDHLDWARYGCRRWISNLQAQVEVLYGLRDKSYYGTIHASRQPKWSSKSREWWTWSRLKMETPWISINKFRWCTILFGRDSWREKELGIFVNCSEDLLAETKLSRTLYLYISCITR